MDPLFLFFHISFKTQSIVATLTLVHDLQISDFVKGMISPSINCFIYSALSIPCVHNQSRLGVY